MLAGLAPAAAAANLRKAVHYAGTALGSPDTLRRHDEILELCGAVVDVEDFEQRAL